MWLAMLVACSPWQTEGDVFFVRNDGADMPVWVRGDVDSGTILVWMAGGPGDPVAIVHGPATERLEQDMAVAFWEQRGAGSAQGNAAPGTFTLDQYADDLDAVVDVLQEQYAPERIVLQGHSWGGMLGTAYLVDPDREAKIAGWIDMGGNHDATLVFPMKLAWLEAYAQARISEGTDVEHWTEVREWCASNPPLTVDNFAQWDDYVSDTNADFHDPDSGVAISFDLLFRSGESLPAYVFVNDAYSEGSVYPDDSVFADMSFTEAMGGITLPVALVWGREDGIVPIAAGHAASDALGSADVRMVVIEESAHLPVLEQPDEYAQGVLEFVADLP